MHLDLIVWSTEYKNLEDKELTGKSLRKNLLLTYLKIFISNITHRRFFFWCISCEQTF